MTKPNRRYALLCLCLGCCTASLPAAESAPADPFAGAPYRLRHARSGRVSSWDRTGDNRDFISFRPGETKELLALEGPGALTHLYMTPAAPPEFLRRAVLRIYWDEESSPSVEAPLGDFFCAGECRPRLFASHYVVVNHGSGTIGYNSYFPMPFRTRARVTLENAGKDRGDMFWYHIEYERYDQSLPADAAYFHAQWRREKLTAVRKDGPEAVPTNKVNQTIWEAKNRTGAENYMILEAQGAGHVVGLYLTCHNLAGGWWGEGDDMIFIDGEGLAQQRCAPRQDERVILGWFTDNELRWGPDWRGSDELLTLFLNRPPGSAGRNAAIALLRERHGEWQRFNALWKTRFASWPELERAAGFERYVRRVLHDPAVVGYHWFQYTDQPKEGRFDGENSNYGVVNIVDGKLSVVMGREEEDHTRTIAIMPTDAFVLQLRLSVRGNQIRGQFRPADTEPWQTAGTCTLPVRGASRVSLQCYQGPAHVARWARLTDFRIEQVGR